MTHRIQDQRYDPWSDLAARWSEIDVRTAPMSGRLLGELRYPVITLRAGSTAAQQRCTLAHEIVHLDRGIGVCGYWAAREESAVHAEAARRLISLPALLAAVRCLGSVTEAGPLAVALEVDRETLAVRCARLSADERGAVLAAVRRHAPRTA